MKDMVLSKLPRVRPKIRQVGRCLAHFDEPSYLRWQLGHAGKLRKFRDRHRGEDCFIIGNGPSLNDMDLTALRGHHTFGLNKIYLIFDRVDLDLSYHVSVNRHVIAQSRDQFEAMTCPTFVSFLGAGDKLSACEHVHYLLTNGLHGFHKNLQEPISEGYTVTFVAMQIAYYMGFRRVFLIGVDHSFETDGQPNEAQTMEGEDVNHFDPDYFRGQTWQLPDLQGSELSYRMARFAFQRNGRQILDATVGGQLEIFPKIPYEVALRECSTKH
jgi:hypothetical protein